MTSPTKLLSSAQTGADRAALDWAIFRDILHGGCASQRGQAYNLNIAAAARRW